MTEYAFLKDLKKCELCEHRCRVNRMKGETGICKVTIPTVASATLHAAPPEKPYGFYGRLQFQVPELPELDDFPSVF